MGEKFDTAWDRDVDEFYDDCDPMVAQLRKNLDDSEVASLSANGDFEAMKDMVAEKESELVKLNRELEKISGEFDAAKKKLMSFGAKKTNIMRAVEDLESRVLFMPRTEWREKIAETKRAMSKIRGYIS